MIKNKVGFFITSSRFSRAIYGAAKAIAFVMLIISHVPDIYKYKPMSVAQFVWYMNAEPMLRLIAEAITYIAVAFCVLRGIPVILESKRFFTKDAK